MIKTLDDLAREHVGMSVYVGEDFSHTYSVEGIGVADGKLWFWLPARGWTVASECWEAVTTA